MLSRLFAMTLALSALGTGASWAAAANNCKVSVAGELPVTMRGQRPTLTAQINGSNVTFLLDSGAFYSTVTSATASALKLPKSGNELTLKGASGLTSAGVTKVKEFTLAGYKVPNIEFIVTESVGEDVGGLLGQNILGAADVEYDLRHGMIRILVPENCARNTNLAYWAPGQVGLSFIDIRAPTPTAPHTIGTVEVNGVKLRAMFDTGAGVSMLTVAAAARLGIKPDTPGVVALGVGGGGLGARPLRTWIAPVASFKLDTEEIKNTRLRFSDFELNDSDMLIGADFFLSHRVYVSKFQRRLYATYEGGQVFNLTSQARAPDAPAPATGLEPAKPAVAAAEALGGAEAYMRRGAVAESRRDFKAALADFDKAVELKPADVSYLFRRAGAHQALRQSDLAKADLDRALKLDPGHLDSLMARTVILLVANDKAGAKADLDMAARVAAKDADIRTKLADLYATMGLFEASLAQNNLWLAAHSRNHDRFLALNSRCWARAMLGRELDAALDDCNRALAINRGVQILDSRGMVHLRRGAYDKAIADYDAVIKLRTDIAWSYYGRGLAKLHKGLAAEGEADLAAAAKIAPNLAGEAEEYGIVRPAAPAGAAR